VKAPTPRSDTGARKQPDGELSPPGSAPPRVMAQMGNCCYHPHLWESCGRNCIYPYSTDQAGLSIARSYSVSTRAYCWFLL